jgi:protein-tyrosine phosphatase
MTGLLDLHLHLLPGVDDGCRTLEDTVAMARALTALGFTTAAPSPHHRPEYASFSPVVRLQRLEETRAALNEAGLRLELFENAEHFFLEDTFFAQLAAGTLRRIGPGRCVLVEAPYTSPLPLLTDLIFRMKLKGVTPVIAHPERCMEFEKKGRAAEAVQAGALLQLDVGALSSRYGKTAHKLARQLLDDGLYALAATDLHSPVGAEAWVGESLAALEKYSRGGTQRLFIDGPTRVLSPSGPE